MRCEIRTKKLNYLPKAEKINEGKIAIFEKVKEVQEKKLWCSK